MKYVRPPAMRVWVRSRTAHSPGHRVVQLDSRLYNPTHTGQVAADAVATACFWTPAGGIIVSRAEAARLMVMPCTRCFGIALTGPRAGRFARDLATAM